MTKDEERKFRGKMLAITVVVVATIFGAFTVAQHFSKPTELPVAVKEVIQPPITVKPAPVPVDESSKLCQGFGGLKEVRWVSNNDYQTYISKSIGVRCNDGSNVTRSLMIDK